MAFLAGEDPENPGQKVLCHIKANLGPKTPSLTYTINEGRFLWGEETSITAEQVLATPIEGDERSKLEEAKNLLEDVLCNGAGSIFRSTEGSKGSRNCPDNLETRKADFRDKSQKSELWRPLDMAPARPKETINLRRGSFKKDEPLRH